MRVLIPDDEHLTAGWITGKFSPNIPPKITGYSAAFFVKALYKLKPGEPATLIRDLLPVSLTGDLPINGDPALGMGYASDFVPYKPVADFAAVGTAHPPKGGTVSFPVRMRVGDRQQELKVFGPWKWIRVTGVQGEVPGPSHELVPVSINYANAWGGPDYPLNPLGCGRVGEKTHLLEFPDSWIPNREYIVGPAVLAPMPPDSPLRKSKMGTYNNEWAESRWPWLPEDFDYSYYNATHRNQWMAGYLKGDEEVIFENMHPEVPLYKSRLPGFRVRCFVDRITNWRLDLHPEDALTKFEEVPMALDTLWANMDEEKLVLVWRGRTPVRSLKRRDLKSLYVLTEPLNEPRHPLSHYHALYLEELAKRPEGFSARKPLNLATFAKKRGVKSAAEIRKDVHAELTKKFTENQNVKKAVIESASKKLTPMEQHAPAEVARIRQELQKHLDGRDPVSLYLSNSKEASKSGPISMKETLAEKETMIAEGVARGEKVFRQQLSDPTLPTAAKPKLLNAHAEFDQKVAAMKARNEEAEKSLLQMNEKMNSLFPPLRPGDDFFKEGVPDLEKMRREGMARTDLDGRDLSGLNLSGIDFNGASLKETQFRDANLTGANFSNASMLEADLTNANLSMANLDQVNLMTCMVAGAKWSGASLNKTNLGFLKLPGADFSGASGERADFTGAELAGANFHKSKFIRTSFTNALVSKADFTEASLVHCDFLVARGAAIRMDGADVTNMGAGQGADFSGGSFQRIRGEGTSWGGSDLTGADFREADLPRAIFSEAKLARARFDLCDLREASFDDAFLQHAMITRANLMWANFDHADLTAARLDHSNLYGAALWNAVMLRASWQGANITKTRLNFS